MSQYFSLRVNKELKDDFYKTCKKRGYSVSRAMRMFFVQYIKDDGKPPYEDMLNRIRQYPDDEYDRIGIRIDADIRTQFAAVCKENGGWLMSNVVRAFMDYCASYDCLPF